MESASGLCREPPDRRPLTWLAGSLALACSLSAQAGDDATVEELRRQLRERDEEIARLRKQVQDLRSAGSEVAPPAGQAAKPVSAEEDEFSGALESALVRQGGRVLPRRTYEIEPEVSYFYDEPTTGRRRDTWIASLNARGGLGSGWQAEVRLPYVMRDRWTDVGNASGPGDIRLGLTKEVQRERLGRPAVLLFSEWRTKTGDIDRTPATGFGQHALQLGITLAKRQDPVVLFGSLSYTESFGSARLADGSRYSSGDLAGVRVGAYLAATPNTSLYSGLSFRSSAGDTLNGAPVPETDRLFGTLELGATTVIGRGKFLNITGNLGVTSAAPRVGLTVSLPVRFD